MRSRRCGRERHRAAEGAGAAAGGPAARVPSVGAAGGGEDAMVRRRGLWSRRTWT